MADKGKFMPDLNNRDLYRNPSSDILYLTEYGMLAVLRQRQKELIMAGHTVFAEWEELSMTDPLKACKNYPKGSQFENYDGKPKWDQSYTMYQYSASLNRTKEGLYYIYAPYFVDSQKEFNKVIHNMYLITGDRDYYQLFSDTHEQMRDELVTLLDVSLTILPPHPLIKLLIRSGMTNRYLDYMDITNLDMVGQALIANILFESMLLFYKSNSTYNESYDREIRWNQLKDNVRIELKKLCNNQRLHMYNRMYTPSRLPKNVWNDDEKERKQLIQNDQYPYSEWMLPSKLMQIARGKIGSPGSKSVLFYALGRDTDFKDLWQNKNRPEPHIIATEDCPAGVGDIIEYVVATESVGFWKRVVASDNDLSYHERNY